MPDTTLLDITQDILSDMDSDEVNSIEDTTEAQQVARIVRNAYSEVCDEFYLESNKRLLELTGLADTDHPTHLGVPEGVHSIENLEYDCRDLNGDAPRYVKMCYLEPEAFLTKVNWPETDANVQEVEDFGGAKIHVRNDKHPTYYTLFDNSRVVLDSFNEDSTATLVGDRTRCFATQKPTLVLDDDTVIDLPQHLISLLRSEAMVAAFDRFKDGAPPSVQRTANRQRVRAQRLKHTVRERRPNDLLPDYGRHV